MSTPAAKQIAAFHIESAEAAEAFYCGRLGFAKDWAWQHEPGFPTFISVSREGHTLYLTEHPECVAGGLTYLYVDEVDAWAATVEHGGVQPDFGPIDQPWGLRELQIRDPDGNTIRVVQDLGF